MPNKHPHPRKKAADSMRDRAFKHGSRALQKLIDANALDQRTGVAKMLKQVRDDLAEDAGGMEHLTRREQLLVERTAAITVILSSIEGYVFKQGSLVDKEGNLLPVLGERYLSFVNVLRLNLAALGLKPPRPAPDADLSEYIRQQAKEATE